MLKFRKVPIMAASRASIENWHIALDDSKRTDGVLLTWFDHVQQYKRFLHALDKNHLDITYMLLFSRQTAPTLVNPVMRILGGNQCKFVGRHWLTTYEITGVYGNMEYSELQRLLVPVLELPEEFAISM